MRVLPSEDYTWAESIAYKLYDIGLNELASGTALTVTTTANTAYIAFANTIASVDTFMLNQGTVLLPYLDYNTDTFSLTDVDLLSVGTSVRDRLYPLNGDWYKDQKVGTALEVAIGDVIDTTAIPTILETTGVFHAVDTVNNEEQYGVYGDTLTLTGTATVYFQLADIVTTEIPFEGSLVQESTTTLIQSSDNGLATEYDIKFAMNVNSLVDIHDDKLHEQRDDIDANRVSIDKIEYYSATEFASITRVSGKIYAEYNETTGVITWYYGAVGQA
jgi:hypothetical protein